MPPSHVDSNVRKTLLIAGIGVLGSAVLDQLAQRHPDVRFVVVSRNHDYASKRSNLTRTVLAQWDLFPEIVAEQCDIKDEQSFSSIIQKYNPDILFNATTPFPWWKIAELPSDLSNLANSVGPGIWSASDAILPLCIANAIEVAGVKTKFVNGCYPDSVNVFLSEHGTGPVVGIGNIANVVPGMKIVLSQIYDVDPDQLAIKLICHHYTSLNAPIAGRPNTAPFTMWIKYGTNEEIFRDDDKPFQLLRTTLPRLRGLQGQAVTASSAALVLSALLGDRECELHAPGPLGLPGGYPILIGSDGTIRLSLPSQITQDEAVTVNLRGQFLDGVEHVAPGLIMPSSQARCAFETILGFDLPDINFENVRDVHHRTLQALRSRHRIELT